MHGESKRLSHIYTYAHTYWRAYTARNVCIKTMLLTENTISRNQLFGVVHAVSITHSVCAWFRILFCSVVSLLLLFWIHYHHKSRFFVCSSLTHLVLNVLWFCVVRSILFCASISFHLFLKFCSASSKNLVFFSVCGKCYILLVNWKMRRKITNEINEQRQKLIKTHSHTHGNASTPCTIAWVCRDIVATPHRIHTRAHTFPHFIYLINNVIEHSLVHKLL